MNSSELSKRWGLQAQLANFDEHYVASCVHEMFERQTELAPQALAVVSAEASLTYQQLNDSAERLADRLASLGTARGHSVGICLRRSSESIIALLSVLKLGAAYVPLASTYPPDRIRFILDDAQVELVLTDETTRAVIPPGFAQFDLDSDLATPACTRTKNKVSENDRAYIMYTSGSTGTPKGVVIPHRAIERLTRNQNCVDMGPGQVVLHAAPLAFDASTIEIWGPLLSGGCIALYSDPVPTAQGLGDVIRQFGVTTAWLTAALFNMVVDQDASQLSPLKQLMTGGEALSVEHVRRAQAALPKTQLVNGYGPTETTTFATCFRIPNPVPRQWSSVPIGTAIRQTRLYCVKEDGTPAAVDEVGELLIGGAGLALEYLNRPELTEKSFVADPAVPGRFVYRTGDLVRISPEGWIDYVGRIDQQVKIRGFRIEPGEIEAILSRQPGVSACVVSAQQSSSGERKLVGYVVTLENLPLDEPAIRQALAASLPDYMVPARFVPIDKIPLTTNGKVDHRALPVPTQARPELRSEYRRAETPLQERLCAIWTEVLDLDEVGIDDNFFELGGSSLLAVRTTALTERALRVAVSVVSLFAAPTIRALSSVLESRSAESPFLGRSRRSSRKSPENEPVAIVGMAGRFPGSPDVASFWNNLCEGREGIRFFTDDEISPQVSPELLKNPYYVKARGVLSGYEFFDAAFFGVTPAEAALMDPQQRVLLEVAWASLEDAGYVPEKFSGQIGIFAGKYNNTYASEVISQHPQAVEQFGAFNTMLANEKDYVATRAAYALNLTGPAVSTHTACSTSLVCVVQAVQALRNHQCDLALAGGVAITVPVESGYLHQEGAMLSPDGHTRSFSDQAGGTVFSDGAAVVTLKRLSEAREDGDHIYAVIRGVAMNNDGRQKASLTAPSVDGQAQVITMALDDANLSARDVSYVEGHGTATRLGDPVEVEALRKAFALSTQDRQFCGLGSVKSNIGHTVIAAGATGLIKTALALQEQVIPASLGFERPNPSIDFENSPFFVTAKKTPWPRQNKPRIAGVSSFGVGGTNAHVIVEEAPPPENREKASREFQLLLLSGRSERAVRQGAVRLSQMLRLEDLPLNGTRELRLDDIAFTLHAGRESFSHRAAVVAANQSDACERLGDERLRVEKRPTRTPKVAFMFPGQGSQYARMGATLYAEQSVFREHFDHCAEVLQPVLGEDLRKLLFVPRGSESEADEMLKQTRLTQPALFSVEYSLAKLWMSFGVTPFASIGHSVGEFVCATLAEVMSLKDALRLVAERGRIMQQQPEGAMLSIRKSAAFVRNILDGELCLAADNAPELCVVSGRFEEIERLERKLSEQDVPFRRLVTSHAFHSSLMQPATELFRALFSEVELRPPSSPFVSSSTGTWITAEQAQDADYWASHLQLPVRFSEGIQALLQEPDLVLLEVGPRSVLTALCHQHEMNRQTQSCLSSLGNDDAQSWSTLLGTAGRLWQLGHDLNPRELHGPHLLRRVSVPTYAFEQQRHWLGPETPRSVPPRVDHPVSEAQATGKHQVIQTQLSLMQRQLELLKARRGLS